MGQDFANESFCSILSRSEAGQLQRSGVIRPAQVGPFSERWHGNWLSRDIRHDETGHKLALCRPCSPLHSVLLLKAGLVGAAALFRTRRLENHANPFCRGSGLG